MNLTDNDRVELNELCSALLDETITGAQMERLQSLLRGHEEARRYYVRTVNLSASLRDYAGEMQTPEPANIVRPAQWRRWLAPLAAAAAVMLGLWLGHFFAGGGSVDAPAEDDEMIARLSGSKDCVWDGAAGPATGDELARGQQLLLKSGFAEVTFDSGALLVIEGPASVNLRSAWEAELSHGTVKANVPQEAIGFRVMHAAVEVVDLGTEFSVTADDANSAEVFVLKGAVEVQERGPAAKPARAVLREKQAKRFAKAGGSEVRNPEEKFARLARKVTLDRLAKPLASARWRLDEGGGSMIAAEANGFAAHPFKLDGAAPEGAWVAGKFGGALEFDGTFSARLHGSLRRNLRTIAFWTRLPEPAGTAPGSFALVPATSGGKNTVLELFPNIRPADGVTGALRVQSGGGWLIGTTPVRDGKWHHIAIVLGNAGKTNKAPAALYVDGRLESLSARHAFRRGNVEPESDAAFILGGGDSTGDRFHGTLDEIVVTDRPLSPLEIRHLMRANELLSPEAVAAM